MSYVYFIGCQNCGGELRVKISFTRRNPLHRVMELQPSSPEELDVLCFVEGSLAFERHLHNLFASFRVHNEWFVATAQLERVVRRLMFEGRGAKAPTPGSLLREILEEEVYQRGVVL